MFGKNEIVGQKWFRQRDEVTQDKLFVTSIFYTLQGEGPYAGMPAVFLRLAKCNLNCSFCDTFFDDGDWLTYEKIWHKILDAVAGYHGKLLTYIFDTPIAIGSGQSYTDLATKPYDNEHYQDVLEILRNTVLVCTGGEPMLQENLGKFLNTYKMSFKNTQIESNGMLWQDIPLTTTLVVSPKCSEKSNKYLKIHDTVLRRLDCLKFVISADPDSPYHTIPDWALEKAKEGVPVYISPMNIYNDAPKKSKQLRMETNQISLKQRSEIDEVISFWEPDLLNMEENQKNHEYAARYALANNLRLNLQIHLYASLA